jgi:hypothetical protein
MSTQCPIGHLGETTRRLKVGCYLVRRVRRETFLVAVGSCTPCRIALIMASGSRVSSPSPPPPSPAASFSGQSKHVTTSPRPEPSTCLPVPHLLHWIFLSSPSGSCHSFHCIFLSSSSDAVSRSVSKVVGRWALARICSGVLVQTNGCARVPAVDEALDGDPEKPLEKIVVERITAFH